MSYHVVCAADYHQGDNRFSRLSRGRQCVPNCSLFLMRTMVKNVDDWNKTDLHDIMHAGDYVYKVLHETKCFRSVFLMPSELPAYVTYNNNVFHYKVLKTYCGSIHENYEGVYPLMPLEHALLYACSEMKAYNILIVQNYAMGIYFDGRKFSIFDSHARNNSGLSSPIGTCVLGSVGSSSELCIYVRNLLRSLCSQDPKFIQYDLHKIRMTLSKKSSHSFTKNVQRNSNNIICIPALHCASTTHVSSSGVELETPSNSPKHTIRLIDLPFLQQSCIEEKKKNKRSRPVYLDDKYDTCKNVKKCKKTDKDDIAKVYSNLQNSRCPSLRTNKRNTSNNSDKGKPKELNEKLLDLCNTASTCTVSDKPNGNNLYNATCQNENVFDNDTVGINKVCTFFQQKVSYGPIFVCRCCTQTFFKHRVQRVETQLFRHGEIAKQCLSKSSFDWVCFTCLESIKIGKVPACFIGNGLQFPLRPPELNLTQLEERLVAPRLAFMQVREMPRGGQLSVRGNIVNVPADVNSTVRTLPRMLNDSETIAVKFKRKLSYKHHVAFEKIRPNKVVDAAKWLVANSVLFQNEGIVVDESWQNDCTTSFEDLEVSNVSCLEMVNGQGKRECSNTDISSMINHDNCENQEEISKHVSTSTSMTNNTVDNDGNWTEDDNFEEKPTGNLDTVLQPIDFREFNEILSLAPGEGNTPLGLYLDMNSEFLAFPTLYCGQTRINNNMRIVPLHYSTICKWELRNVDRRVAMCVPNIFFKLKKVQIKQIQDKVSIALRKCKTKGRKLTAGQILTPGELDKITKQDDGYRVLRTLRGSPPYWEAAKKDIFAMIRQLGIPTWFCSFSAAETKWKPLLKCLWKLQNQEDATEEDLDSLTWQEKCNLIKSDPVTCARYFDHRVQAFICHVLKSNLCPIGEIVDFFYRVEFQQRGSPHIHMLIWIKNAPLFNVKDSSNKAVENFIDKHVTCAKDESLAEFINYQTHRHARTCRKKGKAVCRFSFPLPPMPSTSILHPLDKCASTDVKHLEQNFQYIMEALNATKTTDALTFEEFLEKLGMSLELYLLSIRSSLKNSKVFLKRSVDECRINNYSFLLLKCWEANMDIQFILDPYACVSYIASYISKGQRGLSNLLYQACKEGKSKDSTIKEQVRRIGNQFLNHVEVGAQEASYLVLQMPLRRSSREVVFIDTLPPEKRTVMLKSKSDLEELPQNSINIESDNALKRYKRRPQTMQKYCYADFVSWFRCEGSKRKKKTKKNSEEYELPEENYELDGVDDLEIGIDEPLPSVETQSVFEFRDGTVMKKRRNPRILRYHRTSENADEENHCRELVMLFTAWRDEEVDLLNGCQTYKESYNKVKKVVDLKRRQYEKIDCELEEVMEVNEEDDNVWDSVLPEVQHNEHADADKGTTSSQMFGCFNPGEAGTSDKCNYDLGQDLGITSKQLDALDNDNQPLHEVSNDTYREMVQNLNEEQKEFFYHVLHWVKTKDEPLYKFLSGGAGVGKSVILRTLYQALLKHFNLQEGSNPEYIKILLCAPTGKAAHNVGGNTIHSSFNIPIGRGFQYKPLDMQQLNVLRSKYHHLQIVFIDEISMVGKNMFNFINMRLQEIKGCTKPFGGVSVIAVGDLFQLKPVMDSWIFSQGSPCNNDLHNIATNLWTELFSLFELKQIMRQKDDLAFSELLNRLREGNHKIPEDLEKLKARIVENCEGSSIDSHNFEKLPHLFTTRSQAEMHNCQVFSKVETCNKTMIEAIDNVSGDLNSSLVSTIISKIPNDASKTMGLVKCLCIGIGVPAELCLNICVEDGMTNGTPCTVMKLDYRVENSERCSIVWVKFEESSIGQQWRRKYRHLFNEAVKKDWTPVLETTRRFSLQHYKTYHIVRRQFPLQMAAAKTIHKAQGSTLQGAVVHFGTRKIEHIHYVGLSRVQNLNAVHILYLNEDKISVSEQVKEEMMRLRSHCDVGLSVPRLSSLSGEGLLTLCFHNCRSLHKHIEDVRHDRNVLHADVLAFCETRLVSTDLETEYHLPSFTMYRKDFETNGVSTSRYRRPVYGMAMFTKCNIQNLHKETVDGIEIMASTLQLHRTTNLCFIYCPPKLATLQHLKLVLKRLDDLFNLQLPSILMGDFNQDVLTTNWFPNFLKENYNFSQLLACATTDYNSCLDHIYVNFDMSEVHNFGVLESYFSDHKPVYLTVKNVIK